MQSIALRSMWGPSFHFNCLNFVCFTVSSVIAAIGMFDDVLARLWPGCPLLQFRKSCQLAAMMQSLRLVPYNY